MAFGDYAERYAGIRMSMNDAGVLEMTLHTRGGPALGAPRPAACMPNSATRSPGSRGIGRSGS